MYMTTNETTLHVGGRRRASTNEILLLKAEANYTHVQFNDGSCFLSSTNLGLLEKRLCTNDQFFRPNRSYIINLTYVAEFQQFSKIIKMENNEIITLSRRKAKQFIEIANPKTKDLSW